MLSDIWKGGNNLLLWSQARALLEIKVPDCPRQGKVAIDSAKIYETACILDALLFRFVLRFVVIG